MYSTATDQVLLFSGTHLFKDLIAVSAKDGTMLWKYPGHNAQIVFRDDAVYVFIKDVGRFIKGAHLTISILLLNPHKKPSAPH